MCAEAPEGPASRDSPHPEGVWPLLGSHSASCTSSQHVSGTGGWARPAHLARGAETVVLTTSPPTNYKGLLSFVFKANRKTVHFQ